MEALAAILRLAALVLTRSKAAAARPEPDGPGIQSLVWNGDAGFYNPGP